MLYLLLEQPIWFAFVILLVVSITVYSKVSQRLDKLSREVDQLQRELNTYKDNAHPSSSSAVTPSTFTPSATSSAPTKTSSNTFETKPRPETLTKTETLSPEARAVTAPTLSTTSSRDDIAILNSASDPTGMSSSDINAALEQPISKDTLASQSAGESPPPIMEPDERSLPIVTSLLKSVQNWFMGGNLVVRVGVIVLLIGVVLLLRLLSEYIEIPIGLKLGGIVIAGLALAGLGLKLAKKRFAYGITLQGTGLSIAYLTTYFAYDVYRVIPSLPSFAALAALSAVTIGLAVRQNAFPLALLAFSGGFFAPLLTSSETGSLVMLFSYYLLLNVAIAITAHYRTWKVLNLLGAGVTFGLAYYWGLTENLSAELQSQRWTLVLITALHWLLYLFIVIRYAQQIIAHNSKSAARTILSQASHLPAAQLNHRLYVFPIDIGLLFSVPLLTFGIFNVLLDGITHALTLTSALFATVYLALSWLFIRRSQQYALITEGMLALGLGFLALTVPLALDAEWIAMGWAIQGLALVWFGRRSLRAWSAWFGVLLQLIGVAILLPDLVINLDSTLTEQPTLALSLSALSGLASMFILRASNSPIVLSQDSEQPDPASDPASDPALATNELPKLARALGVRQHAAQQWLTGINSQSVAFKALWQSPILITLLTCITACWSLFVLGLDLDQWLKLWFKDAHVATSMLIAMASLGCLIGYWLIDRLYSWHEIGKFSHAALLLFYLMLVIQLPQQGEFHQQWSALHWTVFIALIIGWLVVGQLWLKTWHSHRTLSRSDSATWLGTGVLVLAAAVHYGLPASHGTMTILIPVAVMLVGFWLSYRYYSAQVNTSHEATISLFHCQRQPLCWFDWQSALLDCARVFVPLTLCWVVITNWYYDGEVWGLPYIPIINLYDITLGAVLLYEFGLNYLNQYHSSLLNQRQGYRNNTGNLLLSVLGLIGFWVVSSMLVRTLHTYAGTPLWYRGAWDSEQVQTGLTIIWTLLALVATIIASRHWLRALWFMGIGLLGIVVLKLVAVDLSQTEAIWRVVSFIGAGSLILLIGYLAPLPPEQKDDGDNSETVANED